MSKEHHVEIGKYYTGAISHKVSMREHKHIEAMTEVRKVIAMFCGSSLQTERSIKYLTVWQRKPNRRLDKTHIISMAAFLGWVQYEVEPIQNFKLGKAVI